MSGVTEGKPKSRVEDQQGSIAYRAAKMIGGVLLGSILGNPLGRALMIRQTENSLPKGFPSDVHNRYTGVFQILRKIYLQEGARALWRGTTPFILVQLVEKGFGLMYNQELKQFAASTTQRFYPSEQKTKTNKLLKNCLVGMLSAIPTIILGQPLRFLKTSIYTDIGTNETKRFKGMADCASQIYKQNGILPFYRGFLCLVAGTVLYRMAYFTLFDLTKAYVPKSASKTLQSVVPSPFYSNLILNMSLSLAVVSLSGFVTNPISLVYHRLQLQSLRGDQGKQFNTVLGGFKYILTNEGFAHLFKGAGFSMAKGIASSLILTIYASK